MYFNVQGIVIREKPYGETAKHLSVLTEHRGILFVTAKGARKLSAKNFTSAQLFAFSDMTLYGSGPYYTLTDAKLIENFYDLRTDPVALSLACYLADISAACATVTDEENEQLRLLLNTLWFLQANPEKHTFIKSVFELRLMFSIGYLPEFICSNCDMKISEGYFSAETGEFTCESCIKTNLNSEQPKIAYTETVGEFLPREVVTAMKYIAFCDLKRLFLFSINEESQGVLSRLSEKYLRYRVDDCDKSLSYYKMMQSDL